VARDFGIGRLDLYDTAQGRATCLCNRSTYVEITEDHVPPEHQANDVTKSEYRFEQLHLPDVAMMTISEDPTP